MRATALLIALPLFAFARSAFAGDPSCLGPEVTADARVRRTWPELPVELREALGGHDELDTCARVELSTRDGAVIVKVSLADGRSTSRVVSHADVVATSRALLLLPEPAPEEDEPPPSPPFVVVPPEAKERAVAPASTSVTPRRLGVELSIATGARASTTQAGLMLGAMGFADIEGWLLGFAGRTDYIQRMNRAGAPGSALSLDVLGGRRLRSGAISVDFYGGSGLMTHAAWDAGGQVNALHLLAGARLNFRTYSVFRTFVAADGDLAIGDSERPWSVGLSVGATVGPP